MRIWRQSPFVAIVAVLALGLGIGFTTTMFSIVRGVTRPLPFAHPEQLVAIDAPARPFDYLAWSNARSFDTLAAYEHVAMNLGMAGAEPERIVGTSITPGAFGIAGIAAQKGRTLEPADGRIGAESVVVLSHALWQRRFAARPDIVGTSIRLTGTPHLIVGVMPAGFGFPVNSTFWVPLRLEGGTWLPGQGPRLAILGRLAEGQSARAARAELETIAAGTAPATSGARRTGIRVIPFQHSETPPDVIRGLYLLVLAVSFVLLIACANVANLLIARAAMRSRDVAVRLALGATRGQLVKEQLAEAMSLSAAAAILGLGLANIGTRVFAANTSHIIEAFWVDFRVDGVVLLFASLLGVVATLASGVGPALRIARSDVTAVLKDRAAGSSGLAIGRVARGMIAVQVALACGLLALTLVFARASVNIRTVPWPIDPASILTFEFELPDSNADNPAARNARLTEIATALDGAPGIDAAALTTSLPGRGGRATFALDARAIDPAAELATAASAVTPEYFALAGARLVRGRLLTWRDDADAPRVAVVNESFTRRFSGDRDVLGRRVFLGSRDFTVVGIVSDAMANDVQERAQHGIYTPILQSRPFGIRVMARGAVEPAALVPTLRDALRRIDPDMPMSEIFTLHEAVYRDKQVLDVLSTLFLFFGIGALGLTAIGLYGLVSFGVTARRRELGIRLALGASRANVLSLVAGQGAWQLGIGLAAGLALALGLSRAFAAAIEQLPPADVPLLAGICGTLIVTVAVALAVPAARAMRLPIMQALRRD